MTNPARFDAPDGHTYLLTPHGWCRNSERHPTHLADVMGACSDDAQLRARVRQAHLSALRSLIGTLADHPLCRDLAEMADVIHGPEVARMAGWEGGARKVANRLYEGALPQPAFRSSKRTRAWTRAQIERFLYAD